MLKYSHVFQRFFDIEISTLFQRLIKNACWGHYEETHDMSLYNMFVIKLFVLN